MSGLQNVRPQENKSVQLSLFPPSALILAGKVLQFGAEKHGGSYNWREKPIPYMAYISKVQRHLMKVIDGEENADDSGECHLAHALCDLAVMIDARSVGKLVDDRPIKGKAAEMLLPGGSREAGHNSGEALEVDAKKDPKDAWRGPAPGGSNGVSPNGDAVLSK